MAVTTEIRVLAIEETKGQGVLGKLIRNSSLALVGQVGFGTEAITTAQDSNPDVILVSLEEPVTRSLRTIELLSATMPNRDIIAVAPTADRDLTRKAVRAGARDYLTAPISRDDLSRAVVAVYEAGQKRRHCPDHHSVHPIDLRRAARLPGRHSPRTHYRPIRLDRRSLSPSAAWPASAPSSPAAAASAPRL